MAFSLSFNFYHHLFFFFFIFWFSSLHLCLSYEARNPEVEALTEIKSRLNDPHGVLNNWDEFSVDPCSWAMITCASNSVIGLGAPSQSLSGTLSGAIANLTNLKQVLLQNNNISGKIPPEIGSLSKLQTLDLSNNGFSGTVPKTLGQLKSLQYLRLNNNSLSGAFPASLANLSELTFLDLSYNNLSGPVPKFPARTFNIIGNPLICGSKEIDGCSGSAVPIPLSFSISSSPGRQKSKKLAIALGVTLGFVLLVVLLLGIIYWRREKRQRRFMGSVHAETSVFEWDDTREDDGGGEFFIKKKDELFGTNGGTRKSCTKPRSSRHHEPRGSQFVGKCRNEKEKQNIHDEMIVHSDSKLMKIRKIEQVKKISVKKKVDNYTDQQLGLDDCGREVLAAEPNAESVDMLNVGIDTQMAAEAMEALATGNALDSYGIDMADEDQQNRSSSCRKKTSKCLLKQSCVEKRTCLSKSGVVTRSQQTKGIAVKSGKESKCFVASRTRSQYAIKELNIDVVNQKGSRGRLPMKNIFSENEKNSSDRGTVDNSFLEREHIRGVSNSAPVPVRRRSLRSKVTSSTPVAWKTRQHLALNHFNDVDDAANCSRGQGHFLDMIQASRKRKHSKVRDLASENANTSGESLILATARGDSGNNKSLVMASGTHEAVLQPIARRARSKRSALCADIPQEGEHVHARAVVSVEDMCQLLLEKNTACSPTAKGAVSHAASEGSLAEVQKSASPANITPPNLKTPRNAASPICVGDGYSTPSCKKMLSLKKEINRLTPREPTYGSPAKELRQRRDMNNIRVLFSQHLDEDVTRQQKRILSRLGVSVASSISDATHFVADTFVRTRNMLEAIAHGKPVVTHLWLESCGQASCFIDEKNYILRDAKKERELGFNMPISLARASRHPLLEGRRVFITPHIKPSKEIISSLVKAVHGQAIERLCRFMPNNDRIPEDLLVLSCEEDFEECMPLLEKGIEIYSSELLLKGIITQKLEYGRYRIFMDHVKKTRSTLWLKKGGEQFLPVTRTRLI